MAEKKTLKTPSMSTKIQRAAQASRKMTIQQRANLMLKAGLLTPEQAEKAANLEATDKAK
jgi:hypothetical protein